MIFITSLTTSQFARKRFTRDETRERIMVKADELFRQFGFEKTTVADIADDDRTPPACRDYLVARGRRRFGVDVGQHHVRAGRRQPPADAGTDAQRTAGDHGDLSREPHRDSVLVPQPIPSPLCDL